MENKMNYGEYLKIDELLSAQKTLSSEHDEMLFIIIHQSYELWFKQILHEIEYLQKNLEKNNIWMSIKTLKRVLVILKMIVNKIDILETMTPLDFKSFRSFLKNSSGFQSVQFRKVELTLGLRTTIALKNEALSQRERDDLEIFTKNVTLWESFIRFLQKYDNSIQAPQKTSKDNLVFEQNEDNQNKIYELIKSKPEISVLCEAMIDFDEGFQEWRYRHVKMVERTIGSKEGTGGSSGVEYLKSTLHRQVFPDLWAIRSLY